MNGGMNGSNASLINNFLQNKNMAHGHNDNKHFCYKLLICNLNMENIKYQIFNIFLKSGLFLLIQFY